MDEPEVLGKSLYIQHVIVDCLYQNIISTDIWGWQADCLLFHFLDLRLVTLDGHQNLFIVP